MPRSRSADARSHAPRIPSVYISRSPLLSSDPDTDFDIDTIVAQLTKHIAAPLPSLSFAPNRACTGPLHDRRLSRHPSLPRLNGSSSLASSKTKPCAPLDGVPPPPPPATAHPGPRGLGLSEGVKVVPSKQIIALLSSLEAAEDEITREAQHLKNSIAEARALVGTYRTEREDRLEQARKRRQRERRDTKQIDSDFWLQV